MARRKSRKSPEAIYRQRLKNLEKARMVRELKLGTGRVHQGPYLPTLGYPLKSISFSPLQNGPNRFVRIGYGRQYSGGALTDYLSYVPGYSYLPSAETVKSYIPGYQTYQKGKETYESGKKIYDLYKDLNTPYIDSQLTARESENPIPEILNPPTSNFKPLVDIAEPPKYDETGRRIKEGKQPQYHSPYGGIIQTIKKYRPLGTIDSFLGTVGLRDKVRNFIGSKPLGKELLNIGDLAISKGFGRSRAYRTKKNRYGGNIYLNL